VGEFGRERMAEARSEHDKELVNSRSVCAICRVCTRLGQAQHTATSGLSARDSSCAGEGDRLGRGGDGGVGGVTGAFFFLGATFLPFAILVKMGARGFSSSVGGADEREESESSMMRRGCCLC
jgi:hypothetical protein